LKITEDTKCWFCHRTVKEVIDAASKLDFEILLDAPEEEIVEASMNNLQLCSTHDVLPVCIICKFAIEQITRKDIQEAIDEGEIDAVTVAGLEKANLKIEFNFGEEE